MDDTTNADRIRRLFDEAWTGDNLKIVDDIVADDFVFARGGTVQEDGPALYRDLVEGAREMLPDMEHTLDDVVVGDDGDVVTVRWTVTGTFAGEYKGVQPTGEEIEMEGLELNYFEDGTPVETCTYPHRDGFLEDVGVLPLEELSVTHSGGSRIRLVPGDDRLGVEPEEPVVRPVEPAEPLGPPGSVRTEVLLEQAAGPLGVVRLQRRVTPHPDVLDASRHRVEIDDSDRGPGVLGHALRVGPAAQLRDVPERLVLPEEPQRRQPGTVTGALGDEAEQRPIEERLQWLLERVLDDSHTDSNGPTMISTPGPAQLVPVLDAGRCRRFRHDFSRPLGCTRERVPHVRAARRRPARTSLQRDTRRRG